MCWPLAWERGPHPWPARPFSRELICPQNQGENVTAQAEWQEPTRNTRWGEGGSLEHGGLALLSCICRERPEGLSGSRHPRRPLSRRLVLVSVSKGRHVEQTPRRELIEARARAEEA